MVSSFSFLVCEHFQPELSVVFIQWINTETSHCFTVFNKEKSTARNLWKTEIKHLKSSFKEILLNEVCFLPLRSRRRRTRYPTGHPPVVCPGLLWEEWRRWRSCSVKSPCWTAPTSHSMWRWEEAVNFLLEGNKYLQVNIRKAAVVKTDIKVLFTFI